MALTRLTSKQLDWFVNLARSVPLAPSAIPPHQPHPKRQRRLDATQRVAVLRAYQAGASMAALARQYRVRRETISSIVRQAGLPVRMPLTISPEQVEIAVRLYDEGWSLERIGQQLKFDNETIRKHLKRCGVVMRSPNDRQE